MHYNGKSGIRKAMAVKWKSSDNDWLCINTIRTLSIDAIEKANSGHPGLPLGAAPFTYVLWQYFLNHEPKNPEWQNRDRFILSAGHGSMLLYSLLHLTGYPKLSLQEIQSFRQWKSLTPGHPEFGLTPGVETTTGPLGQGAANAVGFAISERILAQRFNRPGHDIIDHYTYALVSDGDLMEGVCLEAISLAGHLQLGKLIYLYDCNHITLDGPTSLTFSSEDVKKKFEASGWQVLQVKDSNQDLEGIYGAIEQARSHLTQPTLIICETTIGFGSPLAGTASVHGSPLNKNQIQETKKALHWNEPHSFAVPESAKKHFQNGVGRAHSVYQDWNKRCEAYQKEFPGLFQELVGEWNRPTQWLASYEKLKPGESVATRVSSGQVLNDIAKEAPWLVGGDADLSSSTKTALKGLGSFHGQRNNGRNIHFGVREHAMAAIANGMSYHGGVRPFVSTFFCFADYMRPSIRLAAMNHLPVIYIWTHDSIGLGEDGPTHQPVEHLASLRCIPNLVVYRPADSFEVLSGWEMALSQKKRPFGFVLTRQNLPNLEHPRRPSEFHDPRKGGYLLSEASGGEPHVLLIGTGSEVHLAVQAQGVLEKDGIPTRVVSMPSWELFSEQNQKYQDHILPPKIRNRVSIEAASTFGWTRWVGSDGKALGLDRFGASAPAEKLFEEFSLTVDSIVKVSKSLTAVNS